MLDEAKMPSLREKIRELAEQKAEILVEKAEKKEKEKVIKGRKSNK